MDCLGCGGLCLGSRCTYVPMYVPYLTVCCVWVDVWVACLSGCLGGVFEWIQACLSVAPLIDCRLPW